MRSWLNGYGASANAGGDSGTDYTSDNFLNNAFSAKEKTAIAVTDVVNGPNTDYDTDGGNDTTDRIFLLSLTEVGNHSYFPTYSSSVSTNTAYVADGGKLDSGMFDAGEPDWWWLRSPGFHHWQAAYIEDDGSPNTDGNRVDYDRTAVRPAFNLNLSSVLFTSAATGGKPDGGLTAVDAYTGNDWKLTLKDSDHNSFSVSNQTWSGNSLTFSYAGARTGANEYISAVIEDGGVITHYGRILQPTSASGTASLSLPSNVTLDDTTTLYVFNEQYNGDKLTDYASPLQSISPAPVPNPDPNPNPNPNPNYNQLPVIIIPTTDQNVSASVGNTVTMRITANYAQSYQWYVDTGSGFKAIPGATGAAYTTSQVALGNNGYRYYCVARNAYGTAVSPVFTLNVLEYMGIPATGDSAQAGLWIGFAMVSFAGLAAYAALWRRKRTN